MVIFGTTDAAELAYLSVQEMGLVLVGIVGERQSAELSRLTSVTAGFAHAVGFRRGAVN